jgi:APA family basic amino acid/polyamine antiporter
VKNSKILQTVLTVIKILSLAGLIIFGFMAKAEVWDANWTNAWTSQTLNVETGSWLPISGTALISGISAALVGSMFSSVAWEGVTFIAGEIKSKQCGIEFVLGTLIVSVIYILANIMYLAVVPLYDIATAESDRVAVVASQSIFLSVGTLIIAVMIMISTLPVTTD